MIMPIIQQTRILVKKNGNRKVGMDYIIYEIHFIENFIWSNSFCWQIYICHTDPFAMFLPSINTGQSHCC